MRDSQKNSHSEMSSMMFYADGSKILGNQLRYVYLVGGNWIISPKQIRVKIQHIWNHHPQNMWYLPNIYQQTTPFTYRNMYRHVSGHKTPPVTRLQFIEDLQPQNPGVFFFQRPRHHESSIHTAWDFIGQEPGENRGLDRQNSDGPLGRWYAKNICKSYPTVDGRNPANHLGWLKPYK